MVRLHSYKAIVPIRLGPWIGLETVLISLVAMNLYNYSGDWPELKECV